MKTNGVRRTIFRIVSVHAQDNGLGVSGDELERSAKYQDLLYARTVIGCHRSHRNGPGAYGTPGRRSGGVGVSVNPTKTFDDLQAESQVLGAQRLYDHHKYKNYISIH